jgi:hypothetical protein
MEHSAFRCFELHEVESSANLSKDKGKFKLKDRSCAWVDKWAEPFICP